MKASSGLEYDRYFFQGHSEWLMRIGRAGGTAILFLPPLFEEMNRTRALLVSVMRLLEPAGFRSWLPDLPGTGESERPLEACGWGDWSDAIRCVAEQAGAPDGKLLIASLRGGALLDDIPGAAHWRLAPVEGASLIRDLDRTGLVGGGSQAGYALSEQLRAALTGAVLPDVTPRRTVRLTSESKDADVKLNGLALWRRSEPSTSDELAELIASDISAWARTCGNC